MANITRNQLDTLSLTNFPNNNSQLISPQDLRDWLESGVDSFVTQKDKSTFENAFYEAKGSPVTAATTTSLSTATGNFLHIIGTNGTQIDSFGTCPAGARFILYFEISAIITYNATTLIIPGGSNITTNAGDCMMLISEGSGNWRVVGYFPGTGLPVGTVTAVTATAPISSTGGNAPNLSIPQANGSTDGFLDSGDWTTFNGKQDALVSGTNIKTVNSNSLVGSGNVSVGTITGVTAGTGLSGGGASGAVTVDLANTTVTPNSYTNANITVDAQGRITAASNGTGGGGTPGGSDTQIQYNNGGAFGGVSDLTWDDFYNFLTVNSPRIGQSTGNGHMHMHTINTSPPSGLTDYVTLWADKSPKQFGARFETDAYTSAFQFGATADRTYTLPDATGNVLVDTVIPSLNNGTSAGEIRLKEDTANGNNYTAIKASATLASDYSLTLPTTQGGSGQVIVNDGTGQLSWASNGGSTVSKFLGTVSPATVTGTTSETLLSELLIPANTFTAGDCFAIFFRARRSVQTTGDTFRFYISNQSGVFSGKPAIGFYLIPNNSLLNFSVERNVTIFNATTTYYVNSTVAGGRLNDYNSDNFSTSNIDWTVPQYVIMTCTPGTLAVQIFNISTHLSPR